MQYGIIMAGGSGTRLWPLSRKARPKQLLPLVHGKSLLQLAFERLRTLMPPQRIFVCTRAEFADQVFENLPELPRENLLGEPEGRDTANAVGFAAAVLRKRDPEAVLAVVTADHVIEPVARFADSLRAAFDLVAHVPRALVTFGIIPTEGNPGMGYIQRGEPYLLAKGRPGAFRVLNFDEKPDKATADRYVDSGRYYWNSGMFVWRADTVLDELACHLPAGHRGVTEVADAWDTPRRDEVLRAVYPTLPRISIDFAVMEPVSEGKGDAEVFTVEMDVEWLDVGSWPTLAETMTVDEHDNAVDCDLCVTLDADNNILVSHDPDHLVATVGLSDMIVVHTPDVTMVLPKRDAQKVKQLVEKARELHGERFQ